MQQSKQNNHAMKKMLLRQLLVLTVMMIAGSMTIALRAQTQTVDIPAPPGHSFLPEEVTSVYSSHYEAAGESGFPDDWGQSTVKSEVTINGSENEVLKLTNFDNFPILTKEGTFVDASGCNYLNFDIYLEDGDITSFIVELTSWCSGEKVVSCVYPCSLERNEWTSISIPLSEFGAFPFNCTQAIRLYASPSGATVYLDNIFFYQKEEEPKPDTPQEPAVAPKRNADDATGTNILSVFSDSYTSSSIFIEDATVVTLDDNNTILGTTNGNELSIGFTGTISSTGDVNAYLYLNVWTKERADFQITLGGGSTTTPVRRTSQAGAWSAFTIGLSEFGNVSDISPITITRLTTDPDQPSASALRAATDETPLAFYLDNIYFYTRKRVDAQEINRSLGKGINMGNIFEVENGNPWQSEYMKKAADLGFNHVRLPVCWELEEVLESDGKTITTSFLSRIQAVVDEAIANKLKIIINMHHHHTLMGKAGPASTDADKANLGIFLSQWNQIASHFSGYSEDSLLFEVLNEPTDSMTNHWNRYFNAAIDTIRYTNPDRTLLIGTVDAGSATGISRLQLPDDDDNLIVTLHYYNPFKFTHQGADWLGVDMPEGTKWLDTNIDRRMVEEDFKIVEAFRNNNNNIPIHIGEFGTYSPADMASRYRWTNYMARYFEKQKYSWAYWEFCAGFGIYDPVSGTYRQELVDALLHDEVGDSILMKEGNVVFDGGFYRWDFQVIKTNSDGVVVDPNIDASTGIDESDNSQHKTVTITVNTPPNDEGLENPTENDWRIQLSTNLTPLLTKGTTYCFSFTVSSTIELGESAQSSVRETKTEDYKAYSGYNRYALSATPRTYYYVFTMPEYNEHTQISFDFGMLPAGTQVTLSDVKLQEVSPQLVKVSGATLATSDNVDSEGNGYYANIQSAITAITGSDQSGKTINVSVLGDVTETGTIVFGSYTNWSKLAISPNRRNCVVNYTGAGSLFDLIGISNFELNGNYGQEKKGEETTPVDVSGQLIFTGNYTNGVTGTNVSNVTIRDNAFMPSGGSAIDLTVSGGGATVSGNRIAFNATTSDNNVSGIRVVNQGSGDQVNVYNNMVYAQGESGSSLTGLTLSGAMNAYHNSVYIPQADGSSTSAALTTEADDVLNFRNNNLVNKSEDGYSLSLSGDLTGLNSDWNNYSSVNFAKIGDETKTFDEWKYVVNDNRTNDAHSLSEDPGLNSSSLTVDFGGDDLQAEIAKLPVILKPSAYLGGTQIEGGATLDSNGDVRDAVYPTMGAVNTGFVNVFDNGAAGWSHTPEDDLVLQSGELKLSGDVTVQNIYAAGGALDLGDHTLTLRGQILPSSSAYVTAGNGSTIVYEGALAQDIFPNTFTDNQVYHLTVNSAKLTMRQDTLYVKGNLTIGATASVRSAPTIRSDDAQQGRLEIAAGTFVSVEGVTTNNNGVEGLVIKSRQNADDDTPNASFRAVNVENFSNGTSSEKKVLATVEMFSPAGNFKEGDKDNYRWQFFTTPVESGQTLSQMPQFKGTWIRRWDPYPTNRVAKNGTLHWAYLEDTDQLTAEKGYVFKNKEFTEETKASYDMQGYEITMNESKVIPMQGALYIQKMSTVLKRYSGTPPAGDDAYPGQYVFGNPFTAGVDISQLEFGSNLDPVVYVFTAGSLADWEKDLGSNDPRKTPGQYLAIPKSLSSQEIDDLDRYLSSMQGFVVMMKDEGTATETGDVANTFTIPYSATGNNTTALRSSDRQEPLPYTTVDLTSDRYADRLWLFVHPECSKGYNAGWDGRKLQDQPGSGARLFTMEDDNYQVSTMDDLDGAYLGFIAGEGSREYTLTFNHERMEGVFLRLELTDLLDGRKVDVTEPGSAYTFTSEPTDEVQKRFLLSATHVSSRFDEEPAADAFRNRQYVYAEGKTIVVENTEATDGWLIVYDASGKQLLREKAVANKATRIPTSLEAGVYPVQWIVDNMTYQNKIVVK